MVSVTEAEQIILANTKDYGIERIPLELAMGRVLGEPIVADRPIPACNKATMDGIAIRSSAFNKGIRAFGIQAIIAAGNSPVNTENDTDCVEVMTGAPVPDSLDTVIRYEDVTISKGLATINVAAIKKGQNIHSKGRDKQSGDIIATANQLIDSTIISIAASAGKDALLVRKLPEVVIITTGDELVSIDIQPTPYQVRGSNNYMIHAALQPHGIQCTMLHISDEPAITKKRIKECILQYDVVILTGGVSMGKFDHVPQALEELEVSKLFHKVMQKPGKPFWFGSHANGALVFAFPGNPVSTFLCLHRYFIPWLQACLTGQHDKSSAYAILDSDVTFAAPLQYFMQVSTSTNNQGHLIAKPIQGNGSGDFSNLAVANAFMELPAEKDNFMKGEAYPIWPFKQIV